MSTPALSPSRILEVCASGAPAPGPEARSLLRALSIVEEACATLLADLQRERVGASDGFAAVAARLEALLTAVPTTPSSLALLLAMIDLAAGAPPREESAPAPAPGPALRRALEVLLPQEGRPDADGVPYLHRLIEELFRSDDIQTPVVWTVNIQAWPGPIEFRAAAGGRRAVLSCYHTGKAVTGGSDPDLRAWLRVVGSNILGLRVAA